MPRLRLSRLVAPSGVGAVLAIVAAATVGAQTLPPTQPPALRLPSDPDIPADQSPDKKLPPARRSVTPLPVPAWQKTKKEKPAPSRLGRVPPYSAPPGFGAKTTGFNSTNVKKKKARAPVRPDAQPAPAEIELTPISPADATPNAVRAPRQPAAKVMEAPEPAPPSGVVAATPRAMRVQRVEAVPPTPPVGRLRAKAAEEEDPFAPLGIRVGTFVVKPAIELKGGYDTNPAKTLDGKASSTFVVAPELVVESDWKRHALGADIRGSFTDYPDLPSYNRPTLDSKVTGRVDVGDRSRVDLEARLSLATESPGSANVPSDVAQPVLYTTYGGTVGIAHKFNRVELSAKEQVDRTVYQNATLVDGTTLDNSDRNYNQYATILRGTYDLFTGVKPFVETSFDKRARDATFDEFGFNRTSFGWYAKTGIAFDLARWLTGEFGVGYINRSYDEPTFADIGGVLVDSSLVYSLSGLTKIALNAKTTIGESTTAFVPGVFTREASTEVTHAFRRWLVGTFKVEYGHDDYVGSPRIDDRYGVSGTLAYKFSRELWLKGELKQEWLRSSDSTNDYAATIALVGLRLQR